MVCYLPHLYAPLRPVIRRLEMVAVYIFFRSCQLIIPVISLTLLLFMFYDKTPWRERIHSAFGHTPIFSHLNTSSDHLCAVRAMFQGETREMTWRRQKVKRNADTLLLLSLFFELLQQTSNYVLSFLQSHDGHTRVQLSI